MRSSSPGSPAEAAAVEHALRLQVVILKADLEALRLEKNDQETFYKLRIESLEREIQSLRDFSSSSTSATTAPMVPPPTSRHWLRCIGQLGRNTRSAPRHQLSKAPAGGFHTIQHATADEDQQPPPGHPSEHKGMYQRVLGIFRIGRLRTLWPRKKHQRPVTQRASTNEWHAKFGDNGRVYFVNPNAATTTASSAETMDLPFSNSPSRRLGDGRSRAKLNNISGDSSWV
ncbi:hypothetical protein AaE_010124 [Aphanomyces astaci]|uniref:Uncharacterized protein n=2 Tax=Aphanomyces astaci TaxID=112090 RepID=A0A397EIP5_APHAT|nr:hypothetical protein AaE_010124 [Aphanomyces astaci]RHY54572.1 hypothetical protein DYB38_000171 [Aphanomyces astaci]RHY79777.1 hypothetical protein DYB31_000104 [Aphanomyces astaci]